MFTTLKKMLSGRPAKKARKLSTFRPGVEALDERLLLSVAGFTYSGDKFFFVTHNTLKEQYWESTSASTLAFSVSQVSVLQNGACARADVLFLNGDLREWSDSTGWKFIATGVKQVSAGFDGYSAILTTSGYLYLYNTDANAWTYVNSGVSSASLGTDVNGKPMVDLVTAYGAGFEWRAAGGFALLGYDGVQQVSAGAFGRSAVLFTNGSVYAAQDVSYSSWTNETYLLSGATSVSCGNGTIDVVFASGGAEEYRYRGYYWDVGCNLGSNVVEVDAQAGGSAPLVSFANGSIANVTGGYYFNSNPSYIPVITFYLVNTDGSGGIWCG